MHEFIKGSSGRQQRARDRELTLGSSSNASDVLDLECSNELDGSNGLEGQRLKKEMD
jgi:hypothetical protein